MAISRRLRGVCQSPKALTPDLKELGEAKSAAVANVNVSTNLPLEQWFLQEGPGSYQGGGRIPWRGVVPFEMEILPPATQEGLTFRSVHIKWRDGRHAIIELDETWFTEAHQIEMCSPEAEAKVRKEFNHARFRTLLYPRFQRGESFAYWYYKGSKNKVGTSVSGVTKRPQP